VATPHRGPRGLAGSAGKLSATVEIHERDLRELQSVLGSPAGFCFRIVETSLDPTPGFNAIKDLN
jgi:hypothetical protein